MKNPNKIMSDFIELLKIMPLEQVDTFIKVMMIHREKLKQVEDENKIVIPENKIILK